jgi:hypothetical protein
MRRTPCYILNVEEYCFWLPSRKPVLFSFMTRLCSLEVPSPVMKNPKVRCPYLGDFRLIPDICPDDLDVIVIDGCCGST